MNALTFAQSKIQPPRLRTTLIERADLERRMRAALLGQRLVLLSAPAGYGKTTALSRSLAQLPQGCALAWITVDEGDDLTRFLACLTAALDPFDLPWRVAPESLPELAALSGLRRVADVVLDTLDAGAAGRAIIVLDDAHRVADPRVFELLDMLLRGLPRHLTLVVTSRFDPPLALPRLRSRGELAEFRQAELSFTRDDIERLSHSRGTAEDRERVQDLLDRTGGWAAGLQLSLATQADPGSSASQGRLGQRRLFEYLAGEVFDQMPAPLREFMLRCSVLPELTARRCAQVSRHPRAAELLDEIERRGLFVSVLDSEEFTLRLHDLFRDFLLDRLRHDHASEIPALLERAAEGERDPVRQVGLLLRAGAWAAAEQVLDGVAAQQLASADSAQVLTLIGQFPPRFADASPRLQFVAGLCSWAEFRYAGMRDAMARAASGFEQLGQHRLARRARAFEALGMSFMGLTAASRTALAAAEAAPDDIDTEAALHLVGYWSTALDGPAEGPGLHLDRLTDLLLAGASPALWYLALPWLFPVAGRPGVDQAVERLVQGALDIAGDDHLPLETDALCARASILLWQGRIAEAERLVSQVQANARWMGRPRAPKLHVRLWVLTMVLAIIRDDRRAAESLLNDASVLEISRNFAGSIGHRTMHALHGMLVGDWDAVRADSDAIADQSAFAYWREFRPLLQARLAMHEGRNEEATALLRKLAATSADIDRMGLDALVRISLAICELRSRSPAAAWLCLAPLVERVARTGGICGVLMCGTALLETLEAAPWRHAIPAGGLKELHRWAELSRQLRRGEGGLAAPDAAAPVEPLLSSRELEVVARMAAGDSNKVIARSLNLSPHTVKRHVARIFDRLNVSSRIEAGAWYAHYIDWHSSASIAGTQRAVQ
jgi:LuxR family maltose regulon positive regulatory protein